MKKLLLALFILISVNVFSQDTVILKTGEVIPCRVLDINNSGRITYEYIFDNNNLGMSQKMETSIKEFTRQDGHFINPPRNYPAWISKNNNPISIKGFLYKIGDSSILVSTRSIHNYIDIRSDIVKLPVNDIHLIEIKSKRNTKIGALIGAITGCTAGVILGFKLGDDDPDEWFYFSAEAKASFYGISLGILGTALGAAIGSFAIAIPIQGDMDNFNKKKSKLKDTPCNMIDGAVDRV